MFKNKIFCIFLIAIIYVNFLMTSTIYSQENISLPRKIFSLNSEEDL